MRVVFRKVKEGLEMRARGEGMAEGRGGGALMLRKEDLAARKRQGCHTTISHLSHTQTSF